MLIGFPWLHCGYIFGFPGGERESPSAQHREGATENMERETGLEPATLSLGL